MKGLHHWIFSIGVMEAYSSNQKENVKKVNQLAALSLVFSAAVLLSILLKPTTNDIKLGSIGLFILYLLPLVFNGLKLHSLALNYFIFLVNVTNGFSVYLYGTDANYQVFYIPIAFVMVLLLRELSVFQRLFILFIPLISLYFLYFQLPQTGILPTSEMEIKQIATLNTISCLVICFFVAYFYVKAFQKTEEEKGISEKEREKTVQLFHSVFDRIPMDVALFDLEGRFLYLSKYGIKDDELRKWIIGKTNLDYFIRRNSQLEIGRSREKNFNECVKTLKTVEYYEEFLNSKGEKRILWRNFVPVIDEEKLIYVVGFGTDITEVRESEFKLSEQNEELKSLNEELDRMVYGASHDLRAPIATVMGLIELSQREQSIDTIQEYLKFMSISLQKLERFIQDLTNYSRNRRLALELEKISVREMAENVFKMVLPVDVTNFQLEFVDLSEVPLVSDKRRLEIVFNNLISNAIKYRNRSYDHQSKLNLTWKVNEKEAQLIFEDNGKGIPEEHLQKVFQMFYRAHPDLPGTGIGLFIVSETIRFLHGNIQVESEEGKWTRFTIRLPNRV
jgi:signal transduction histidine kinase